MGRKARNIQAVVQGIHHTHISTLDPFSLSLSPPITHHVIALRTFLSLFELARLSRYHTRRRHLVTDFVSLRLMTSFAPVLQTHTNPLSCRISK
jgi:hypothetical protein